MQISPLIAKNPSFPHLRVAVMVRSWSNDSVDSRSHRVRRTCDLLSMVCREPVKVVAVSDARSPLFDRKGLAASVRAIETGDVDLVVAESCYEISCTANVIRDVVKRCIDHEVRFIAFQDQIDTAESDYAVYLDKYLVDNDQDEE